MAQNAKQHKSANRGAVGGGVVVKDRRLQFYRTLVESLAESIQATVRIQRWDGTAELPEQVKQSAAKLQAHLATVHRLASDRFVGSPAVVASLTSMRTAALRLESAYLEYRRGSTGSAPQRERAASALNDVIEAARAETATWP